MRRLETIAWLKNQKELTKRVGKRICERFFGKPVESASGHKKFITPGYGRGYIIFYLRKGKVKPEVIRGIREALMVLR